MKKLYITTVMAFSGKTALTLGIGLKLQAAGKQVGYIKPISTQPYYVNGKLTDEDAVFVSSTFGLTIPPHELSPIIIDTALFDTIVQDAPISRDLRDELQAAVEKAGQGKDVLLIEGGANMREGYAI